ncbi:hypothetical protein [Arthrobacter sp. 7Tela_A1]|uniref:hypothetical protein n=1 Tax=Arthrobacter sp. 7Tela_A1 TaxID=3093745 RepID=UPI003BB655BB
MGNNLEIWAVLVSAIGIITTCIVESLWYGKQMRLQTAHFDTQIKKQSEHLQEQFNFEIDSSRKQRLLSNQREALDQVRRIARDLVDLREDESTSSRSRMLGNLEFELFTLSAMTATLVNDSDPNQGRLLQNKVKSLVEKLKELTDLFDEHPDGAANTAFNTDEIFEKLPDIATLLLDLQPRSEGKFATQDNHSDHFHKRRR